MQKELYKSCPEKPTVSVSILDNCVGQNKSQVVMMFYALLSILFYEKVVCLYLIPGHSFMTPDRVLAWIKSKLKGSNLFTPQQIVCEANKVESVNAEFIGGTNSSPFYKDFKGILAKYFTELPPGYTFNYLFEFDSGSLNIKRITTTPESEATTVDLVRPVWRQDLKNMRKNIVRDLFGKDSLDQVDISSVVLLPVRPKNSITETKLASLFLKLPYIPTQFQDYYPAKPVGYKEPSGADGATSIHVTTRTMTAATGVAPKQKPGPKPKLIKPVVAPVVNNSRSIMSYFPKSI
jgi:hypothetical protein